MLLHLGSVPTFVTSSSQVAQEIMKTHDLIFSSRPNSGCKDVAFSPNGDFWRQLKSIVVSRLLSSAQVKSYRKVRERETSLMISALGEGCGLVVGMSSLLDSLTNKIVCRVALGRTYDGLKLNSLLKRYLRFFTVFNVGSYFPWLSWVDRLSGLLGRAEKVTKEFDEFLEAVIEEHVNTKRGDDAISDEGQDFIDILLNVQKDKTTGFTLDRDTLKAVILDIFGDGIDDLSTNLEWIISELIRNPRVMKKLQKEVSEISQGRSMIAEEDLEKMHYLKAVIKEGLRLHPSIPHLIPRKSTQDVELMGYDIRVGTQVLVNVWEIARDPILWEEPTEFRPERFLTNSINYKGLHFEWLPFGAGRRSCPGILFGVAIIEAALANIVHNFDLKLPNGLKHGDLDMNETYGITVHRKSPLLVTASPRL